MIWAGSYPTWLSIGLQRKLSAVLSPMEIIAVPSDGTAIVVYRGFEHYYYDEKGRHRWGHASYSLLKGSKGWEKH
jgi:hypothetical protein